MTILEFFSSAGYHRARNGNKARVAKVDEEVRPERPSGEVVEAAGAEGGIGEDRDVGHRGSESEEDVGDGQREEQEAVGELEGDVAGVDCGDAVEELADLEVVVLREERHGGVKGFVVEDRVGDLRLHDLFGGCFCRACCGVRAEEEDVVE